MDRFRAKFSLIDNSQPHRRVRIEEAIAAVLLSIKEDPNKSIRHRAQESDLCPSTLWKILQNDFVFRAYKIQLVQELKLRRIDSSNGPKKRLLLFPIHKHFV